jgi:hypothetical protein
VGLDAANNAIYALALIPGLALFAVFVALVKRRFGLAAQADAEILRLTPVFRQDQPLRTEWFQCDYSFEATGQGAVHGRCFLPLAYFLAETNSPVGAIWKDARLGLPVLVHGAVRRIGAENIEHYLLGYRDRLAVRYALREPERNAPAENDALRKKILENKSSSG